MVNAGLVMYLDESVLRCKIRPVDATAMREWPGIISRWCPDTQEITYIFGIRIILKAALSSWFLHNLLLSLFVNLVKCQISPQQLMGLFVALEVHKLTI